jgi:hypothetical protein
LVDISKRLSIAASNKNNMKAHSDLFETPELWPDDLSIILHKYSAMDDIDDYRVLDDMLKECKAIGYAFEYYLDATPYNLKKINS